LVVRASTLRHDQAEATLDKINSLATAVLGMVVNGSSSERTVYAYGSPNSHGSSAANGRGSSDDVGTSRSLSKHLGNDHAWTANGNGHSSSSNGHPTANGGDSTDEPAR
jgi:hypothetical protein